MTTRQDAWSTMYVTYFILVTLVKNQFTFLLRTVLQWLMVLLGNQAGQVSQEHLVSQVLMANLETEVRLVHQAGKETGGMRVSNPLISLYKNTHAEIQGLFQGSCKL